MTSFGQGTKGNISRARKEKNRAKTPDVVVGLWPLGSHFVIYQFLSIFSKVLGRYHGFSAKYHSFKDPSLENEIMISILITTAKFISLSLSLCWVAKASREEGPKNVSIHIHEGGEG